MGTIPDTDDDPGSGSLIKKRAKAPSPGSPRTLTRRQTAAEKTVINLLSLSPSTAMSEAAEKDKLSGKDKSNDKNKAKDMGKPQVSKGGFPLREEDEAWFYDIPSSWRPSGPLSEDTSAICPGNRP